MARQCSGDRAPPRTFADVITPCPWCGYDWPANDPATPVCKSCGGAPLEPGLRSTVRTWAGVRAGLLALPRGLHFLVSTRGVKRWIVPPALLTFGAFIGWTWWLWSLTSGLIERLEAGAQELTGGDPAWWRTAIEWLLARTVLVVLANLTGGLLVAAIGFIVMLWTFSLLYEVLSGPFLDEIHGRIEQRWFGRDPRDERERPQGISASTCLVTTSVCGASSLALLIAGWMVGGWIAFVLACAAAYGVFAFAMWRHPAYDRWLRWRVGVEVRTLAVSLQASAISMMLLVFALPLLFVPVIGYPLFGIAAGFTTAVSLLDIPMSRRRWSFGLRVSFVFHHLPAVLTYGIVASLVFMVPIVGPLAMVPVASVGGLWLVCRLDKSCVRRP